MSEGYFKPEIGDLRVGYEYEITYDGDKFSLCKIATVHDMVDPVAFIIPHETKIPEGHHVPDNIRVPYLTEEQIIAEEWVSYSFHEYTKRDLILKHHFRYNDIEILRGGTHLYQGECTDINTFRYVCKLLGI